MMNLLTKYFLIVIYSSTVWCTYNLPPQPTDVDLVHLHYPDNTEIIQYPNSYKLPNYRYPCYRRKHERVFSMNEQVYPPFYPMNHHGDAFHDEPISNPIQYPFPKGLDSTNINISPVNIGLQGNQPTFKNDFPNDPFISTQIPSPPHMINNHPNMKYPIDKSYYSGSNNDYRPHNPPKYPIHQNENIPNKNKNESSNGDKIIIHTDPINIINNDEKFQAQNIQNFDIPNNSYQDYNSQYPSRRENRFLGYAPANQYNDYLNNYEEDYPMYYNNYPNNDYYTKYGYNGNNHLQSYNPNHLQRNYNSYNRNLKARLSPNNNNFTNNNNNNNIISRNNTDLNQNTKVQNVEQNVFDKQNSTVTSTRKENEKTVSQ